MRQILLALGARDVKVSTIDFACYIARLTDSNLICALMDSGEKRIAEVESASTSTSMATIAAPYTGLEREAERLGKNELLFNEICSNREVNSEFLPDPPLLFNELIKESRFADLIIADAATSLQTRFEGVPTVFLEQLLKKTECPVFVAPESFEACEEIIFAYDGSDSAMFAIKQFTHLFPEFRKVKFTVLEISDDKDRPITEGDRLAQWLKNYYSNVNFKLLYGNAKDELFGFLLKKEKVIVVMGAFGRTMLSSLVSKSNAELILKAVNLPVFISHN